MMDINMDMAGNIFGRCPTCVRNMFRLICDFTCSPEQGRFVRVTNSSKDDDKEYVVESEVEAHFGYYTNFLISKN